MEPPARPSSTSLFQVYLRLRPPPGAPHSTALTAADSGSAKSGKFIIVEDEGCLSEKSFPTHITITPPVESRKKAVEKFGFTRVFEEDATQLDLLEGTGLISLIDGLLGKETGTGRDGLFATLGVTGSGKSYTLLGSKEQRGLTQLTLDTIFRSLDGNIVRAIENTTDFLSIAESDPAESHVASAELFFEPGLGEGQFDGGSSRAGTPSFGVSRSGTPAYGGPRAPTPRLWPADHPLHPSSIGLYPPLLGLSTGKSPRGKGVCKPPFHFFSKQCSPGSINKLKTRNFKEGQVPSSPSKRTIPLRVSALPQAPETSDFTLQAEANFEYAILISMYEVYNDRIFDLLGDHPSAAPITRLASQKDLRRRPLMFKPTELSPDRKVVTGLRKIICGDINEALMVLETGLCERKVSGTNSNSVSSRSHGFFCLEVKKRVKGSSEPWTGATLTLVDLAGSERARNAKTSGSTLAEAGKINESLMYLGQCLQMQSGAQEGGKNAVVPFRQCKLTELLFSNSFPSTPSTSHHPVMPRRNAQKAIMMVTADPVGDFNATSQILRYSALAREVTVPRIPSISNTILAGCHKRNQLSNGRDTPSVSMEELEIAMQEIEKLKTDVENLKTELSNEMLRRQQAEIAWEAAEEKCLQIEQDVREACSLEMDLKFEEEQRKWKRAWEEEADRCDEHMDKKIELVTQSIKIHEDPSPSAEDLVNELEAENAILRRKLDAAERKLGSQSPTRKPKPKNKHLTSALPVPSSPLFSSPLTESAPRDLNAGSNTNKTNIKISHPDSDIDIENSMNDDMVQMSLTPTKKSPRKNVTPPGGAPQTSGIPQPFSLSSNAATPKKIRSPKKHAPQIDTSLPFETDEMDLDHHLDSSSSFQRTSLVGAPTMHLKSPAPKRIPTLKKKQGKRKLLTSRRRDLALSDDEDSAPTFDDDGFLV
ncbi:P-loop containing nucleoside triphosphate hydrolase protein [Xylona heveae TC161]|uniref:Kinesin-like protein n=1 Tax=Xylona heveae (strain CBS 132557 / TC161) TaxID=1328760 RepID=A0A164ZY24_XYLHT|nr:P-loop containing nucleoside triphosphate hydrolase protein [Xylona heveae TC161]KZF19683.1 P-loop containing nucleoside triphosphate hydrolase protein [Xylona heveae TC161]